MIVVTIALAIGATTSVFTVVRGLLLAPLPFREPERLVRVFTSWRQYDNGTVSTPELADLEQMHSLSAVGAWGWGAGSLAGRGAAEHIGLGRATSSLLPALGVRPALGRWFTRDEEQPGRGHVVVLGRALWRRSFGADPGVVGRTVEITGVPFTVIGVLGDELELPEQFDAWRPLTISAEQPRGRRFLRVIGRLAPGVELPDLQRELSARSSHLAREFAAEYPSDSGFSFTAVGLRDQMVRRVRLTLWMLFAAVALVLLMACANVGNLLLARATARERELAVRAALGAPRSRLVRQLLLESLLLALAGGALGALLAAWGVDLLLAAGPADLPRMREVRVDGAVFAFALGASVLSGALFGVFPALGATSTQLHDALRGGSASAARRPRQLRRLLVAADVALALVLAFGAALLLRSFARVLHVEPGFDPRGAVAVTVGAPGNSRALFESVLQRLRETPGVTAAGGVDYAPLSGVANDAQFEIEGRPVAAGMQAPDEEMRVTTPGFFAAMGIAIRRGRAFSEREPAPVAVIDESLARKYWPGEDAIGKRFKLAGDERWWTVAGVAADVREFGLDAPVRPTIYVPLAFMPADTLTLVVRSKESAAEVTRELQQMLSSIDPRATAHGAQPLEQMLSASLAQRTFALELLHGFALIALLLAGIGLYGVLAYSVVQRTREIGVRLALGARPAQAVALVARESGAVVGAGLAAGLLGALLSARLFAGLLYGVGPLDLAALAAAVCALALVAVLATLLPARRATRVDPAIALRAD